MGQLGENDDLQDLLGYGDANSSKGDLSCTAHDVSTVSTHSDYNVSQIMSTPRRRSHRPGPRRMSPPVPTPQRAVEREGDENSADIALAFTPGKTKLDKESLLALQVCVCKSITFRTYFIITA